MSKMPGPSDAYALRTEAEIRKLYADWAPSYDDGFGAAQGYQLPRAVALSFLGAGGTGPVLDVGAGTGLLGEELAKVGLGPVDALDLSEEMLAVARGKSIYRTLVAGDLTASVLDLPGAPYAGIVSSGTFTRGHAGPDGLPAILRHAAPGALVCLGINAAHFDAEGFAKAFEALSERIEPPTFTDVRIYDDRADAAHRQDLSRITVFRLRT